MENTKALPHLSLTVSGLIFKKEAILATLCRFSNRIAANIECHSNDNYNIVLTALTDSALPSLESIKNEFLSELIDQQVRYDLERSSGKIRELIVEHAFSPIEDIKVRLGNNG